jgi:HPt (histidine-containing phosphotransfer) domain-containing protein
VRAQAVPASVDLAAVRAELREAGAEDMLDGLVQAFLQDAPGRVAAIEDAIRAGDCERIRLAAHAYKSSARQLGARALGDALQALEQAGRAGDLPAAGGLFAAVRREHATACAVLAAETARGE